MKISTRIRIVIFSLMIFGAFANFALNEWGLKVITYCELAITLSFIGEILNVTLNRYKRKERKFLSIVQIYSLILFFILNLIFTVVNLEGQQVLGTIFLLNWTLLFLIIVSEAVYDLIKKQNNQNNYEHFFLAMCFYGLYFRNMDWPGAGLILVLSILLLIPFYLNTTIRFFKLNYQLGKPLVVILCIGSIASIFLGITYLAKTLHWPSNIIYSFLYVACILSLGMIYGLIKWNFTFNNNKINMFQALKLFQSNIILVFYITSIIITYKILVSKKIAPDFRTNALPDAIYKLRESGFKTDSEILEHESLVTVYRNFTEHSQKNGFTK